MPTADWQVAGTNLVAGGLGRAGAQFLFVLALLVVAAGVLAAVIVVITVGGAQIEGVSTTPITRALTCINSSEARRRAALGVCPERETRITRSASTDRTTESVTDKHGGVSMMMWSYSLRQRAM